MNSKDFTRENGMPPPVNNDSPWTAGGVVLAVMATAVLMALGSALNGYDEGKNAELQALADAERNALAQPATVAQVRAAYEAGQADAMAAVKTKPQGVALAQACLALGAVDGGLRGVAP